VGENKEEMRNQVRWVSDYLPDNKPVHLLGVGQLDDIIELVQYGIDTFDCVEPTRLARMGVLLTIADIEKSTSQWKIVKIEISSNKYTNSTENVESPSKYVSRFSYAYLHHLFKQKELLGYTLATMHNLAVMEQLMQRMREEIEGNAI
jgi:tRNA-guanine family transglycosylase